MRLCKIFSQVTEDELNQWFSMNPDIEIDDLRISDRPSSHNAPVYRRSLDPDKPRGDYELVIQWVIIFYRSK